MNLSELREKLKVAPNAVDADLLADMDGHMRSLANGNFLAAYREQVEQFDRDTPIRPHFPNKMQIMYMRDRQTFLLALFPELLPVAYQVGRIVGAFFDAPRREGMSLADALSAGIHVADMHEYGHQEVVHAEGDFAVYRTYECADCYGLPNIGMKICVFEAGVSAGAIEKILGRPVWATEVRCCANGDPYCEYELRVGAPPAPL